MRKNLFLILALFAALCTTVYAAVTVEQSTDVEYLINSGYSEASAEEVFIIKNRVNGQPCEPLYEETNNNKIVRFLKRCYSYLDPVQDSEERYHHDIKQTSSYTDL